MEPGEVAEFDTRVPYWFGPAGDEPIEILSVHGRHGERMQVRAAPLTTGKATIRVYDFADARVPVLRAMHARRLTTYKTLGFTRERRPSQRPPSELATSRATTPVLLAASQRAHAPRCCRLQQPPSSRPSRPPTAASTRLRLGVSGSPTSRCSNSQLVIRERVVPSEPHAEHGGLVDDVGVELDVIEARCRSVQRRLREPDASQRPNRSRISRARHSSVCS